MPCFQFTFSVIIKYLIGVLFLPITIASPLPQDRIDRSLSECSRLEPMTARLIHDNCQAALELISKSIPGPAKQQVLIRQNDARPRAPYLMCPFVAAAGGCVLTLNYEPTISPSSVIPEKVFTLAETVIDKCIGSDPNYDGGRAYTDDTKTIWIEFNHTAVPKSSTRAGADIDQTVSNLADSNVVASLRTTEPSY